MSKEQDLNYLNKTRTESPDRKTVVNVLDKLSSPNEELHFTQTNLLNDLKQGLEMMLLVGPAGAGKSTIARSIIPQAFKQVRPSSGMKKTEIEHLTMETNILNTVKRTGTHPLSWDPGSIYWTEVSDAFSNQLRSFHSRRIMASRQGIDLRCIAEGNFYPYMLPGIGSIATDNFSHDIGYGTGLDEAMRDIAVESYSNDLSWWLNPQTNVFPSERDVPFSSFNTFSALNDFIHSISSHELKYHIYFIIPSLPTLKFSCIMRSDFTKNEAIQNPDLKELKKLVPFNFNKKNIPRIIHEIERSAPPAIVLRDMQKFTRIAKVIAYLRHINLSDVPLPDWVYQDNYYSENPYFAQHLALMSILASELRDNVLKLKSENSRLVFNRPADLSREKLQLD